MAGSYGRGSHLNNGCALCGQPFKSGEKIIVAKEATVGFRWSSSSTADTYTLSSKKPLYVEHVNCPEPEVK